MRELLTALSSFGPAGTEVDFQALTARLQTSPAAADRIVEEAEHAGLVHADRELGNAFPVALELTEAGRAHLRP